MRRTLLITVAGGLSLLLAAATAFVLSLGFVHDEVLVGPYRLVAIDVDEDMFICWSLPSGDCVGDGLPGPTVFAAGYDEKYLVAAVHPKRSSPPNKNVTQYYYVIRSADEVQHCPIPG